MRSIIIIHLLLQVIAITQFHPPDIEGKMDFLQMSAYHNFPTEEHFVTTQDGYILRIFRIQANQIQPRSKVIFWQHGLLDSAAGGLCNDQQRAPIYMLAERGYDVWVGNSRGNIYSRNHTHIDPNTEQFWDFTFADMAQYDIPAVLTYINTMTSQKIHYIGHSQGTTQMFAALSKQYQGVSDNLLSYHALAPVAFLTQDKTLQIIAGIKQLPTILQLLGIHEITSTWLNEKGGRILCALLDKQCLKLVALLMDFDSSLNNKERVDVMVSHFLAGTSIKNILHWRQLVLTRNFVEFDGTPYDLNNIDLKVHMYVGTADKLGDVSDNLILQSKLPQTWYKEYELGHSSFLLAKDMSYMLDLFQNIESI